MGTRYLNLKVIASNFGAEPTTHDLQRAHEERGNSICPLLYLSSEALREHLPGGTPRA